MNENIIALLAGLISFFAAFTGTFAGGGSSLIMLPLLILFAPYNYIGLLALAKLSACLSAVQATNVHLKKKNLYDFRLLSIILINSFIGTAIGTYLVQYRFDEYLYNKILGVFLIICSIYLFVFRNQGLQDKSHEINLTTKVIIQISIFCLLINILNGLFGGTGIFFTIFFVSFLSMSYIKAAFYTSINYAIINLFQSLYLFSVESVNLKLILSVAVFSIIGGYIGTHLQYLKGNLWIKRASVSIMIILAIKLLVN